MTQVTGTNLRMTLTADSLKGDKVVNRQGEHLGKVEDIMLDLQKGCVSYVVVSYGGIMGMGDKLFAVPWQAFTIDEDKRAFVLEKSKAEIENAPGFDKDNWPDMTAEQFEQQIHGYYGTTPSGGMMGGGTTGGGSMGGGSMGGGTTGY